MNDAIKHTFGTAVSGLGFVGSITLAQVNLVISILCGVTGTIAACCTIHSWWRKRHKNSHK